jgi:hypothetical protein
MLKLTVSMIFLALNSVNIIGKSLFLSNIRHKEDFKIYNSIYQSLHTAFAYGIKNLKCYLA